MCDPSTDQPQKVPTLEYGRSPYAPIVRAGEQFLKHLQGFLARRWRDILTVVLLLIVLLAGLIVLLLYLQRPQKVADIAGPASSGRTYELWYDRTGDLTLRTFGNPSITYQDYYGSVEVVSSRWQGDDHLFLTMKDGTTIDIQMRFDIDYGRKPTPTTAPTGP